MWGGTLTPSFEPDHDDLRILEVATEVGRKLSISRFNLKQVKWVTGIESDRVSFRMRHFRLLLLPLPLKGLLQANEWQPLIASDIMLGSTPGQRRLAVTTGLAALLLLLGLFGLSQLLDPTWLQVLGPGVGIPVVIYLLLRAFKFLKNAVLLADKLAASVVGTNNLLQVLKKIDELKLPDVERRKARGRSAKHFGWPDITERMENLQTIAPYRATKRF